MWKCPKCDVDIADQFTACWQCSEERPEEINTFHGQASETVAVKEQAEVTIKEPQEISHPSPDELGIKISTTDSIPGRPIAESFGLVCGESIIISGIESLSGADKPISSGLGMICSEAVPGWHFFMDMFTNIASSIGGRSNAYETKLKQGRKIALSHMAQEAKHRGADAIVGTEVSYQTIGNSMMMICVAGTAIKLA